MALTLPEKARKFAVRAHGDQKYGVFPYSVHLDAVAALAKSFGPVCEAVAFLHDVVEDTSTQPSEILGVFGSDVASAVYFLTDPEGVNRRERKEKLHRRLAGLDPKGKTARYASLVLIVKACDRLANLRECSKGNPGLFKMYAREHKAFRDTAYRPGLCDEIWTEIDSLMGA